MFSVDVRGLLPSQWDRKESAKLEREFANNKGQTRLVDKLSQKSRPDTNSGTNPVPTGGDWGRRGGDSPRVWRREFGGGIA